MTAIAVTDLTQSTLEGTGIFDVLMRATKVHLDAEFAKNRIKGSEYATVYLGSLEAVMRTSLEFLMQKQRIGLEADLLAKQILLAQVNIDKITAEVAQVTAQTALLTQQRLNAVTENGVIAASVTKAEKEALFITQKTVTELAQTTGAGIGVDSYLGKQISVLNRQASGYLRDSEQKAAKIMADAFVAMNVSDVGDVASAASLDGGNVSSAISKLLAGAGT